MVAEKTELDKIINYNEHAIFMSEIAVKLLEYDNYILITKGVRELIAMYLLIPYITNIQLDKPDSNNYNIPKLDINSIFTKLINEDGSMSEITLDGLRNAICHSFVTIEENQGIILDDRASCNRKTHDRREYKGFCNRLEFDKTRKRLLELHNEVIKQQKDINSALLKDIEI